MLFLLLHICIVSARTSLTMNTNRSTYFVQFDPQKRNFGPLSRNFTQILKIAIEMNSQTQQTYVWMGHT